MGGREDKEKVWFGEVKCMSFRNFGSTNFRNFQAPNSNLPSFTSPVLRPLQSLLANINRRVESSEPHKAIKGILDKQTVLCGRIFSGPKPGKLHPGTRRFADLDAREPQALPIER